MGPKWRERPMPKLCSIWSDWLLACMARVAMEIRELSVNTESSPITVVARFNTEPISDTDNDMSPIGTDNPKNTAKKKAAGVYILLVYFPLSKIQTSKHEIRIIKGYLSYAQNPNNEI